MALLAAIYAAYAATDVLSQAVAGRVAGNIVLEMVGLRTLIACEVLLPTSLYMAVVWGFTRLDRDAELSVLRASGVSLGQLFVPVLWLALIGAAIVATLTLQLRPWAYRTSYHIESQLVTGDPQTMEPGRFYQVGTRLVLIADAVSVGGVLHDVFAEERRTEGVEVIRARELRVLRDSNGERRLLEFRDGTAYLLREHRTGDQAQHFKVMRYPASGSSAARVQNHRRARDSAVLRRSSDAKDIAELQWRASLPLTTALMVLLSAAIGVGKPRTGVFPRLILAVAAYVAVFNVAAMARTLVEKGHVPPMPGLWWALLVPGLAFIGMWLWRR
jgi:lipopolysaccharide export system permease protein